MTDPRSNRAEIRNPILALPALPRLVAILVAAGALDAAIGALVELQAQAGAKAQESHRKNKWMMFAYWKCVGVYIGHFARAIRKIGRMN